MATMNKVNIFIQTDLNGNIKQKWKLLLVNN